MRIESATLASTLSNGQATAALVLPADEPLLLGLRAIVDAFRQSLRTAPAPETLSRESDSGGPGGR